MQVYSPLVSILIPCYNGQKYINKCLESCTNQTYEHLDILIIDDGSTDATWSILNEWKNRDKRIRIIKQKNKGLGETRNVLISKAIGDYITFVDIDDSIPKDAIKNFVKNSKLGEKEIIVGRTYVNFSSKNIKLPFIPNWWRVVNMSNGHYIKSNICTPWASLIKKSFLVSLNPTFLKDKTFEDIGVMTYVFMKCKNFKSINKVVYFYTKQHGSQSLSSFRSMCFKKNNDVYHQLENVMKSLKNDNLLETKQQRRYVNGLLFQTLPMNVFLSTNLTKNRYFKYLMRWEFVHLLSEYQMYLKFSKTFWKTLTFFYLWFKNHQIFNDIKKSKFNHKFIYGNYGESKNKNCLTKSKIKDIKKSKDIYYFVNIDDLNAITERNKLQNCNVVIEASKVKNWKEVTMSLNLANAVPFIYKNLSELKNSEIDFIINNFLGIFINIDNFKNFNELYKFIYSFKNNNRKRLIYVVMEKDDFYKLDKEFRNEINGVFFK